MFGDYHKRGRIDDREGALEKLVTAGVNPNTAKTYYVRFRDSVGLPKSVRATRAESKVQLSAKPPTGRLVRNGTSEPVEGTVGRAVWDMAEVLYRKTKAPPTNAMIRARMPDTNIENVKAVTRRWRKFHGIEKG